jgi:hypothetical protein
VQPGGEKTEGKEEAAETGRELYISDGLCSLVCASHEREAPDSFPFCASLACILSSQISRSPFPASQSHIPPDPRPRLSLFPSVADKTSFPLPLPEFSSEQLSIRSLFKLFKFISLSASLHPPPNPHPLLLDGPYPTVPLSSNLLRSICPNSRGNNSFFGHSSCHSALSPCHVSPTRLAPLVLLPYVIVLRTQLLTLQAFVAPPTCPPHATIHHHCVSLYLPTPTPFLT